MQNLISMSYLDKTLQQEPIGYLCADVAVFAWAIPFEKVFALPTIVFDLNRCHKPKAFLRLRDTIASLDKSLALLVEKIMSNVPQNSIAHDFVIISEKGIYFCTILETDSKNSLAIQRKLDKATIMSDPEY